MATYPAMAHLGDLSGGTSDYGSGATALRASNIGVSAANPLATFQLTVSPSPWVFGPLCGAITFTATITVPYLSWNPTGSVTFMDGGTAICNRWCRIFLRHSQQPVG